jgi:hypothetical protein
MLLPKTFRPNKEITMTSQSRLQRQGTFYAHIFDLFLANYYGFRMLGNR